MGIKVGLTVCALAIALIFVTNCNQQDSATDTVTVTGVVEAFEWDDDDNITAVAIFVEGNPETEDEEYSEAIEYAVVKDKRGKELLQLVGATVQVTGSIESSADGRQTIRVKKYEVLETETDESGDDELY